MKLKFIERLLHIFNILSLVPVQSLTSSAAVTRNYLWIGLLWNKPYKVTWYTHGHVESVIKNLWSDSVLYNEINNESRQVAKKLQNDSLLGKK